MEFEDKLDYLTENTSGIINSYIRDVIKAYYSLENDFEELEDKYEDIKDDYSNYKEHSRPLTAYEESGMRDADFY